MFKKMSEPLKWLVIFLMVVVVASLSASLVQNSFFSVKVSNVSFETERGELAGLLYMPRGVDATNPAPAVILTHGYLNNKEMQEEGAIELSKRGYVVLAFDMYDHGDSSYLDAQFAFYVHAVYDAAQYMYDQNYVLKAADGDGMIGVSGHSMGGFSSTFAVVWDEVDFMTTGVRKIAAALPVGSDLRYAGGLAQIAMIGPRSYGTIAAHYDQFFFDNDSGATGSVRYKDFANDSVGLAILGRTAEGTAEAGVWYSDAGGQRVVYTPDETHPQNTWSPESTGYTIDFFEKAFTYQLGLKADLGTLESFGITTGTTGQSWWLKELFTLIALLALIAMIFPLFALISKLPVFDKVYSLQAANAEVKQEVKAENATEKKIIKTIVIIFATVLSAYYIKVFMDRSAVELGILSDITLYLAALALFAVVAIWVGVITVNGLKGENKDLVKLANKVTLGAVVVIVVAVAYRWLLSADGQTWFATGVRWGAPAVNTIVYWALCAAGLMMLINVITSFYMNQGDTDPNPYGIKATPVQIGVSLLNAIAMVIVVLFVVALTGWIFKTDFRIYTFAIQIFNGRSFVEGLRYIPLFFIYYFSAGVAVYLNTKSCKKGWMGDILAAVLLAGPVVVFLVYQYATLYASGVAAYPTFSLSGILTVGLVPTLSFAAIIMRRISIKTGNIWTGVFFSSIFFTLITLANTIIYTLSV